MRLIGAIKPYADNPRKIPEKAINKVAASISAYGWRQPIVVDNEGTIIVGHTRLLAAKTLGLKQVPVHVAEMTTDQANAYRIADNRVAEETSWNIDALAPLIGELKALDVDLRPLGFDARELEKLNIDGYEGLSDPDAVPALPEIPVTKTGDVWLLGDHRLLCGNSTAEADVAACVSDLAPHLMVTDPPYGVNYEADWRTRVSRTKGFGGSPVGAKAVGRVDNDDQADWTATWSLFAGDVAYIWHASLHADEVFASIKSAGFALRAVIVWNKNRTIIGRGNYHWSHEPCAYAVRNGKNGHWQGARDQSTVWEITHRASETGHSTQKPAEAMRRPIANNSERGEAVYDPFVGSGTTIIAAEMLGRRCLAIEINPAYVDVCVKRWQAFTGGTATLEATGEIFGGDKVRADD
jgi:DNA modification methylase